MAKRTPKEAYIVFRGRKPGIYRSWPECQAQVEGFSRAKHGGYHTLKEAETVWRDWAGKANAKLLATEAADASVALNNTVRYQGESVHQPAYWIEPPAPVSEQPNRSVPSYHFESSSPESSPALFWPRIPAQKMPGEWPQEIGSYFSFEGRPVYQSRHFPLRPANPSTQLPQKTGPLNNQPLYVFDPPLPSHHNPNLKRPVKVIDLTGECREPEFTNWQGPIAKRVKREADTDANYHDQYIKPEREVQEPNTVEERQFLAELERKEEDRRGRQAPVEEQKVELSVEQNEVLKMALRKNSIFLTGAAGSGKTVTLKEIMSQLKAKGKVVEVIAPTGIAALPLGGRTTYSFAGWTPDDLRKPIEKLLEKRKKRVVECIKKLDVLIVEEISMVENQFLERLNLLFQDVMDSQLDAYGERVQLAKLPFGGKQVIFLGDFHQLPPVKPFATCLQCGENIPDKQGVAPNCISDYCKALPDRDEFEVGDHWAFRAPVWRELRLRHVQLQQIHRQKDTRFQDILNKIRNGVPLTDEEWQDLERPKQLPRGAFAVRLMSRLNQVNSFNEGQLAAIKFQANYWKTLDASRKLIGGDDEANPYRQDYKLQEYKQALRDHRFQDNLALKVGARVVLLQNLDFTRGLVNGSQGIVVGFQPASDSEIDKEMMTGDEKPWRLGLIEQYREMNMRRPLVRFANGITISIPVVASASLRGGSKAHEQYVVCRTQIPLTLAWALSIHKSQGMTLGYVEVSSKDIFESGQLYVALSRATELEGLTLTGFSREQLPMDKDVLEFYKTTKWEKLTRKSRKKKET